MTRKGATVETATINAAILTPARNLPTVLTGEVERIGYTMLRALDRMGFTHETRDGALFSVRFEGVNLYGDRWAAYTIDSERLYHFSTHDLSKPRVLSQLSAATKKPVRAYTQGGLAYVVQLQVKPRVRLPDVARLDLAARPAGGDLLVPLGIGRDGATWRELRDLGHSLIVGTSGSGKSTFVHSALAGLLSVAGPERLRVALVDPKRSEFTAWRGVPHLLADIANTPAQAADLLRKLAAEVDRRGDLLASKGKRDLTSYNNSYQPLPYILCVIDECLDFADEKGVTEPLKTIARRGRSAGVILWAATQHGAAIEGLPRVVNVNLTTRFVFRVADDSAARVAGAPGAESLPRDKPGRMLAKIDGAPLELQGFTVGDDKDLADVVRAILGEAATPKASAPALTEAEAALVRYAVGELGGYFPVNRLARNLAADGWTNHKVNTFAHRLERAGLLEKPSDPASARRVSAELAKLAGAELAK